MSTYTKLNKVYQNAKVLPLYQNSRYVLMSDCHRGVGNWNDNFLPNQNLFFAALQDYYRFGYTYIELGDGDELWENSSLYQIIQTHSSSFWMLSRFYRECRMHMLYGNHDKKKKRKKYTDANLKEYYCESCDASVGLFPDIEVVEGIRLLDERNGIDILLAHGHQGDLLNDIWWRLGRFLVRYAWRPLERLGVRDPTSAAKNYKKKKRVERKLSHWSEKNGVMLITGHTHRSVLPDPGEVMYCNTGCCVHPRCITALEIEGGRITLVKWSVLTKPDKTLYVGREVLEGPKRIKDYFTEGKQE